MTPSKTTELIQNTIYGMSILPSKDSFSQFIKIFPQSINVTKHVSYFKNLLEVILCQYSTKLEELF